MAGVRFKLDENLPAAAAVVLRAAGHEVATIVEEGLGGASDLDVHAACRAEGRAVVMLDRGFVDPRRHPPAGSAGIVVLRVPSQDVGAILDLLRLLVPLFAKQPLEGSLWVVEPHRVRIRRG